MGKLQTISMIQDKTKRQQELIRYAKSFKIDIDKATNKEGGEFNEHYLVMMVKKAESDYGEKGADKMGLLVGGIVTLLVLAGLALLLHIIGVF
jgi:hypothetical protein